MKFYIDNRVPISYLFELSQKVSIKSKLKKYENAHNLKLGTNLTLDNILNDVW